MKSIISPVSELSGTVFVPASKSVSQRVIALAALSRKKITIYEIGDSDDEKAAISIIEQLGAKITRTESGMIIDASLVDFALVHEVDVNESGLSTRMFIPILANSPNEVVVKGHGSILTRPMHFFEEVLPQLGIEVSSKSGCLPISVKGPLQPKSISVDGSYSSQYITGLIYGFIASGCSDELVLTIRDLKSTPYLLLSLEVLKQFGVSLHFQNNQVLFEGKNELKADKITVEGDWSSASFLIVGAAISGKVKLENLAKNSAQSDIALLEVLQLAGVTYAWEGDTLFVEKSAIGSFEFDATDCPDLFPPLAVLAVFGTKTSKIKGVHRLIYKESNRAVAIQQEFGKLGVKVEIDDEMDEMLIYPTEISGGIEVDAHNDHRMAMALTLLGLFSEKGLTVQGAEAVSKSFPSFFEVIEQLVG